MTDKLRPTMELLVTDVEFDATSFLVKLEDGRELRVPLTWFPALLSASPEQRAKFRISALRKGLHWEELDEDISVEELLLGRGAQDKKAI